MSSVLRIFSYLPNPRVWKAEITAKLIGKDLEIIGDKASELGSWLWDFEARKLDESEMNSESPYARKSKRGFQGLLFKTDNFLKTQPFGTVPAAFSPDGTIGIFESNSILRAVARANKDHTLYGSNDYEASRIDSFLDAGLVFSREVQVYLLEISKLKGDTYDRMKGAYEFYIEGIERSLQNNNFLIGSELSIADISFFCDFSQFLREGHYEEDLKKQKFKIISENLKNDFPKTFIHLYKISEIEEVSSTIGSYLDWFKKKNS